MLHLVNLINSAIPSADVAERAGLVLSRIEVSGFLSLPLIDGKQFIGMLTDDLLYDLDPERQLSEAGVMEPHLAVNAYTTHPLSLFAQYEQTGYDVFALVDHNNDYLGAVSIQDLARAFGLTYGISKPGAIVVLAMRENDFSLGQLARLAEADNAKILASFVGASEGDSSTIEVTLKLDTEDATRVLRTFERFGFTVLNAFHKPVYGPLDQDRLGLLMKYLEI